MLKTFEQLTTEIDEEITSNGSSEITGPILNAVLKNIAGSFGGSYFEFPVDSGVTESDIGKLMMNDGSGTAKVYQLSPETEEQTGRWIIFFESLDDLQDLSLINVDVKTLDLGVNIFRTTWRDGATPTTVAEEMELIRDYINDSTDLPFLTASIVDGKVIIEEASYQGAKIKLTLFPATGSYVDQLSLPALPAAPASFPLGKLLAIDGESAIISSNPIETYLLDGTLDIDNNVFNYATDLDIIDANQFVQTFEDLIIFPTSDGKVRALDLSDFIDFENNLPLLNSFRHHLLGIAIRSTSTTVTVFNTNTWSLPISIILRLTMKVIKLASEEE